MSDLIVIYWILLNDHFIRESTEGDDSDDEKIINTQNFITNFSEVIIHFNIHFISYHISNYFFDRFMYIFHEIEYKTIAYIFYRK